MKAIFLAIITLFLLFSFTPKPSSSLSSAVNDDPAVDINDDLLRNHPCQSPCPTDQVQDDKGRTLKTGKAYYILFVDNRLKDHVLKPDCDKVNEIWKPIVVPNDGKNQYTAVQFSQKHSSFPCNRGIEFVDQKCPGKTVWKKASRKDDQTDQSYIELTASDDPSSWFRFVKDVKKDAKPHTYSIIYSNNNNCFNVSDFPQTVYPRFLALSKDLDRENLKPLLVEFKAVEDAKEKPLNPDRPNISTEMPTVLAVA